MKEEIQYDKYGRPYVQYHNGLWLIKTRSINIESKTNESNFEFYQRAYRDD